MKNSHRALVIVFDGVEEIEALTPVDILRRADIDVTLVCVTAQDTVTGRNEITFSVDASLESVHQQTFDLVVLPGGPGVLQQLDNPLLRDLLLAQDRAGRELAALCAAPKLLATHGLLDQRSATSHSSVRGELPRPSDASVVSDQNLTTSQGVGTAVEFSLALVKRLKGQETAVEIAKSIHFSL